ncbi:DUF1129 domain-containing protein [Lacticaseibacillus suihuaensis]
MAEKEQQPVEETVDVDALLGQLTNKNNDYVFKLRRILTEHQWSEEKQRRTLAKLLPEMIEAQRAGKPANQLFGPVTEKADSLIHAPKALPKANVWLSGLDLSLLFAAIFGAVYGVMVLWKPDMKATGNGLPSLLVMGTAAGFMFAFYNDWSRKPKEARGTTWKMLVAGIALVMVASFLSSAFSLIKSPLTQQMPWPAYAAVAVLGFGGHWFLKRKYNLRGFLGQ